jgi:hypothetical protein
LNTKAFQFLVKGQAKEAVYLWASDYGFVISKHNLIFPRKSGHKEEMVLV